MIELAASLSVTPETIRRDLDALESAGRLRRTHGGAIATETDRDEPFDVRRLRNAGAKDTIARRAIRLAIEHDVITLDASTTSLALATLLPDVPRTVLTNSLPIATELAGKPEITTILTGGVVDPETLGLHGVAAIETLQRFSSSIAFVSCFGFDECRGAGETTEPRAELKRMMVAQSDCAVLLADRSKRDRRCAFYFCPVGGFEAIITDDR